MIIESILDNDLYALTTMNALARTFPKAEGTMRLKFREEVAFTSSMIREIREQMVMISMLKLKPNEYRFLKEKCYYFDDVFFTLIKGFQFDPEEVSIWITNSDELNIKITGPLFRIPLWEVPLMAIISEVYFKHTGQLTSEENIVISTKEKLTFLEETGIPFSEFGTRRRESRFAQDTVVSILKGSKLFNGTSNVHLAYKYDLTPIGTFPHLWVMANGAIHGYKEANYHAFENWSNVYDGSLGIALTDTYTTKVAFEQMSLKQAKLFDGLRQDSGCPLKYFTDAIYFYKCKHIDPSTKTIVFSDGLNKESISKISKFCTSIEEKQKPKIAFGIGTWLTNGFDHYHINMVIKLTEIKMHGKTYSCVKVPDDVSKANGDLEEIELCKTILNIE